MTSKRKNTIKWLALIIATLVLVAPYAYTVCLSVPSADDFSMAYTARLMDNGGSLINTAARVANYYYVIWGGTWVSFFLEVMINPLLIFIEPLNYYGFEMLALFCTFLAAVFLFLNSLLKNIFRIKTRFARATISIVIGGILLSTNIYMQIFYWFVGSCYNWAVSFAAISSACILDSMRLEHQKRILVVAALFGILACNTLCMDFPLGVFTLTILIQKYKAEGKIPKDYSILLVLFVISGCVSAFAPGNFVRHGTGTSIDVIFAVKRTALICLEETVLLLKNKVLLAGEMTVFIIGLIMSKNEEIRTIKLLPLISMAGVSVFGAMLPVVIGYNGSNIPNRIQFIFDFLFLLFLITILFDIGLLFGRSFHSHSSIVTVTFATLSLVLLLVGTENNVWYKTLSCIPDAEIESRGYKSVLDSVKYNLDDDVIIVIDSDEIPQTDIIHPPEITSNEMDWVNVSIAGYYDKNTVRFVWK